MATLEEESESSNSPQRCKYVCLSLLLFNIICVLIAIYTGKSILIDVSNNEFSLNQKNPDTPYNADNSTNTSDYYFIAKPTKINDSYSNTTYINIRQSTKINASYKSYVNANYTRINNSGYVHIKYGDTYYSLINEYDDDDIDNVLNIAIITAHVYNTKTQKPESKTGQLNQIKDMMRSRNTQYVLNKNKLFRSNNQKIYYDYYEFFDIFTLNTTNNTEFTDYQQGKTDFMDILHLMPGDNEDSLVALQKMFFIKYVLEQPNKYKYILWKDWDSIFLDCSINLHDIINNSCTSQDVIIDDGYNDGVFFMKNSDFIKNIFIDKYWVKILNSPVLFNSLEHDNAMMVAILNGFFQTFDDKDFQSMKNVKKLKSWRDHHAYRSRPHSEFKSRVCFIPKHILQTMMHEIQHVDINNIHEFIIHFPGGAEGLGKKLFSKQCTTNPFAGCVAKHWVSKLINQYDCHP